MHVEKFNKNIALQWEIHWLSQWYLVSSDTLTQPHGVKKLNEFILLKMPLEKSIILKRPVWTFFVMPKKFSIAEKMLVAKWSLIRSCRKHEKTLKSQNDANANNKSSSPSDEDNSSN